MVQKILKSRQDKRRKSNMSIRKSPSLTKNARKPLKCRMNVIDSIESKSSSKKKLRSSPRLSLVSQPENISLADKNMIKSRDSKFKTIDSVEIDVLSNFTQSNKKISSSSRQSDEIQPRDVINSGKNISQPKPLMLKRNLHKLSVVISPSKQNRSPCRKKRQSFYRQSNLFTPYCENPVRKMLLNDMDSKMVTPKTIELSENLLRSQDSMVLRSAKKDERTSNDMLLCNGSGRKRNRKSITESKNLQIENPKKVQSLPSKLEKASVQKNKVSDLVLRVFKNSKMDINDKSPKAVESFKNRGSSRAKNSMTLRTRNSSEKALLLKNVQIDPVSRSFLNEPLEDVESITSSSRCSMTLRTRHNSEKPSRCSMTSRTRHNSEPCRNRISLQNRDRYKKASNNLLSDEMTSVANREQIKEHTDMTKEQISKNVKTKNKSKSSTNQETEIQVSKHKRNDSVSKCSLKSKYDLDSQTPKMIPSRSPRKARSSTKKSLSLVSRKNSEPPKNDLRGKECAVILSKALEQTKIKKSAVSPKKQNAVVNDKKNVRKRLAPSPIKTKTPNQRKRKLSVKFKKQARPRSFSAVVPIDSLSLMTPAIARRSKSDGFKFSGRNTLKRKRFVIEEIKKADDGYEDDIYESKSFDHFKDMFPDSSDSSELSWTMQTPKLASSLTPVIRSTTPVYKDCFSPTEYALNRKIAEEYIYRNKKKKRTSQVETPKVPEKKKLEFIKVVDKACAVQKEVEKLTGDSSDEEDAYFTDDL